MRVCVIGAGPSGLACIKQCKDEGLEVQCFEKGIGVGGIWNRTDDNGTQMKCFDDLTLTISGKLMAFSDFMLLKERQFYSREQYQDYLEKYARHFGLEKHIAFKTSVKSIVRKEGIWEVTTMSSCGKEATRKFTGVAVCCGPFQTGNMPPKELQGFTGEIVHSSLYRNPEQFRGKRVVVVGLAESGADIVRQISNVTAACVLSVRTHSFLLPRLYDGYHSTDSATSRCHADVQRTPTYIRYADWGFLQPLYSILYAGTAAMATVLFLLQKRHNKSPLNNLQQSQFPLKLDIDCPAVKENVQAINVWNRKALKGEGHPAKVIFSKNVSFIPNLVNGKIVERAAITGTKGRMVSFSDGSPDFEADYIVRCTGFQVIDPVYGKDIAVKEGNARNLFAHSIHPDYPTSLAYIGFARPFTGGIPVISEMQSRLFAAVHSGRVQLPSDLEARITADKAYEEKAVCFSPNSKEAVPSQIQLMDGMAQIVGCLPSKLHLLMHPYLFCKMVFGEFNQASYRLVGPHSSPDAEDQVYKERISFMSIPMITIWMNRTLWAPKDWRPAKKGFSLDMYGQSLSQARWNLIGLAGFAALVSYGGWTIAKSRRLV